jgi:hypothetical protein
MYDMRACEIYAYEGFCEDLARDDSGQTRSADTLHPQTLSAIESEMT